MAETLVSIMGFAGCFTRKERYAVVNLHTARGRVKVLVAYVLMGLQCCSFVFGFRDLLWVLQGQGFISGALYPSKSGLKKNKTYRETCPWRYAYRETHKLRGQNIIVPVS